jgi:hypothetical protein
VWKFDEGCPAQSGVPLALGNMLLVRSKNMTHCVYIASII